VIKLLTNFEENSRQHQTPLNLLKKKIVVQIKDKRRFLKILLEEIEKTYLPSQKGTSMTKMIYF
jgi:hypothetical protein